MTQIKFKRIDNYYGKFYIEDINHLEYNKKSKGAGGTAMEVWDIYDNKKQRTGRTMMRNDWCLKDVTNTCTCLLLKLRSKDAGRVIRLLNESIKSTITAWTILILIQV